MTRGPSDLLAVVLMARDAGVSDRLDVVPLFETVADLHAAPETMERLFENPAYAPHLAHRRARPRRRGRGGGPLRLTEQGESVTNRYSNRALARRHLEQLVHAVLVAGGGPPPRPPPPAGGGG